LGVRMRPSEKATPVLQKRAWAETVARTRIGLLAEEAG
jgi:hypothetical protein